MPYISVDIDMGEIDTEDLVHELARRRAKPRRGDNPVMLSEIPPLSGEDVHPLHRVYYRLKLGDEHGALTEMRTYLADELGVIL